jgi:hypothetical protein
MINPYTGGEQTKMQVPAVVAGRFKTINVQGSVRIPIAGFTIAELGNTKRS